jgi:hypothetical protein
MSNIRTLAQIKATLEALTEEMKGIDLQTVAAAELVPAIQAVKAAAGFSAALDAEIQRRAIGNNESIPGVARKPGIAHRKWNDEEAAGELAYEQFGLKAFKLVSPAAIEEMGDAGKALVAVGSFKPPAKDRLVY